MFLLRVVFILQRLSTFVYVTVSLLLGTVILSSLFGTNWHVAEATISSPYRAFSREKIYAKVVVRVGMQSVNISLQALARFQNAHSEEINFNERFYWIDRKSASSCDV
jgi:dual oxidase maturation factor 1